jgi:hypothetical protein
MGVFLLLWKDVVGYPQKKKIANHREPRNKLREAIKRLMPIYVQSTFVVIVV